VSGSDKDNTYRHGWLMRPKVRYSSAAVGQRAEFFDIIGIV
jgi:hypothetical protein